MKLKKICLILALVAAAVQAGGCGKDADDRERENSSHRYEQEEIVQKSTAEPEATAEPEPTEQPLRSSIFASAKPGNVLQFGTYEQDNNLSNGAEPIEWVVLANEGDKIFVVSKYVLAAETEGYKDDQIANAPRYAINWSVSNERKWLNDSFYEEAFTEEEKNCILESEISTPDTEGTWPGRRNQSFHTYGGPDTQDYLFSLSYEEFKEYVKPLKIALAEATAVSGVKVNSETGYVRWLLRSPGSPEDWDKPTGYAGNFSAIDDELGDRYGEVPAAEKGKTVWIFSTGTVGSLKLCGLRPAMWLRVK